MSDRTDAALLCDIQQAIQRLLEYAAGMTYDAFVGDTRTQDAVIRNLEIVGEAAKNLSHELLVRYPDAPWKSMAGVRDRLIHDYFGVNLDIVWQIASVELPKLAPLIAAIRASRTASDAAA